MKRGTTRFILGLAAVLALAPLAWWALLREPVVTPLPVPKLVERAPDAGLAPVTLGALAGQVQVRRGDGPWVDAREGAVVASNDGVRTGDRSSAELLGGAYWSVQLESGTEVGVGELSASISRLLLERGMARAQVLGDGRHTFEVRASHSDAVATADGGAFTMVSNGQGTVAVGTAEGAVLFSSGGRAVIVRQGQQSLVKPGESPTAPQAIPSSLLLKVALPPHELVNTPRVLVRGRVEPGSRVSVDGHVVLADAEGRFATPVQLQEGANRIEVDAQAVGARSVRSVHAVELDTKVSAPVIDSNLWK